jgi:hypothetical protein
MSEVIYEPRSLWSIQRVVTVPPTAQAETHSSDLIRAQFVRNHLKNPSRYPITITRIAVAPINYTFRQISIDNDIRGIWNAMSNLQIAFINVGAPQRQLYMGKPSGDGMRLSSLLADARAEPIILDATTVFPSGLFGICYLEFDKPLTMPKLGTMEFQPSNYTIPTIPASLPSSASRVSMLWHEQGGSFAGAGRQKQNVPLAGCNTQPVFNPDNPIPYAPDAWGFNIAGPGPASEPWPPRANFSARDISRQNLGLQGSNVFKGFSIHIDQIDIDASYQNGITNGFRVSPLSTRMGCRMRTVDGGSNENWWTPGAPICLVLDTITPATVYPLPKPIVLEPGDTLDAALYIPPHVAVSSPPLQPVFNIGISFNGYATIEG